MELEGGSDLCHFNVVLILSVVVVLMQVVGGEIRTLLPCQSQTFLWLFAKKDEMEIRKVVIQLLFIRFSFDNLE